MGDSGGGRNHFTYQGGPMGGTYSLTLVRHGQSLWNLENRFTG